MSLISEIQKTSALEWAAVSTGVLQVVWAAQKKIINFYAGIVSVILFSILFYQINLYAEALLNIYYLIISIGGIANWKYQDNKLPITSISSTFAYKYLLFFILIYIILYSILFSFTNSNVIWADTLVASLAWIGSYMLMQKKMENWIVLNLSNIIAIPLQIYKHIYLTALLTCIYFVVAIIGYIQWKKEYESNKKSKAISK